MGRVWDDFLRGSAATCGHAVEIYRDLDDLGETVASFLAAGFAAGEPALLIARAEHADAFSSRLADSGWDPERLEHDRLLVVADAHATRAEIMDGAMPAPEAFERVVAALLDRAAALRPGRRVRVFGEIVDALAAGDQHAAAAAFEELWNAMARSRRFSLLCGYRLDVFDREAQAGPLPDICRVHSHVLPAHDAEGLSRAVRLALDEVLGRAKAGDVYYVVGNRFRDERLPIAQRVLMWVTANMPEACDRILSSARGHYLHEQGVSA
ncbi:MAG: MEDS domain-containing protein [Gaiellaceae bacterium]